MESRGKVENIMGFLRIRTQKLTVAAVYFAGMCLLTGCGNTKQQAVTITQPLYEKISYQTTEVLRGDMGASVTLQLNPEGYEEIHYYAAPTQFQLEGLKLEEIHVSVGDRVKKGDILVSFESEKIQKQIAACEEEKEQKELLVQHYENIMEVDPDADYETDIAMLREDIRVAQLYIEEAGRILAEYQIVAERDGIVTDISEYLQNKVIEPKVELLTQISGTGRYIAVTADTGMFTVGDVYTVCAGDIEYEFRLETIEDGTLIFQPLSGMALVSADEKLTLTLEMPRQEDVVYVNRYAVNTVKGDGEKEDTYCVFVMKEDGYQRAVFVTPGERIGDNIIITEGLSGGEKVVIR